MKKIVVISDTHFNKGFSMPRNLIQKIADCDLIIHCGDFSSREFYDFLSSSKKLIAVKGNNDHLLDGILTETEKEVEIEGFRIKVLHGHFMNLDNIHLKYSDYDIVLFGHTHHPSIERHEDQMILNPGSLTGNRYIEYNTFMILELEEGKKPEVQIFKTT